MKTHTKKGFTLLELLLAVVIMSLLAGLSVPIYQSFQVRNDLDVAAAAVAQDLRRAQMLSEAVDGDVGWGVHVQSGSIRVFKGTVYATRDSAFDEVFDIPTSITATGTQEFIFSRLTGEPQATGTLIFNSTTNETRMISVNSKGVVSY